MRILIVALMEDNYGDMLIRTCCTQLLRVVLKNLGTAFDGCEIDCTSLKEPEVWKYDGADLILFPGGDLFGLRYLGFSACLENVLREAEARRIPVVFSSVGIVNTEAEPENAGYFAELLNHPCVRAVSVREDPTGLAVAQESLSCRLHPVCDPAVWTRWVYSQDLPGGDRIRERPLIGINLARGGLFHANETDWSLDKEEVFSHELAQKLHENGIDCVFFTNGQTLDGNALMHFADRYGVPDGLLRLPDTARELVGTVAEFDATVTVRMHASIVSYALGIPSVNLVWNRKIPAFYQRIGWEERAIGLEQWTSENVAKAAIGALADRPYAPDPAYLMTLYRFLYETLRELFPADGAAPCFSFERVCALLAELRVDAAEDVRDLRVKVRHFAEKYSYLFISDRKKLRREATEKCDLEKQLSSAEQQNHALQEQARQDAAQAEMRICQMQERLALAEREAETLRAQRDRARMELDRLNRKLPLRIYTFLRRCWRRLFARRGSAEK